MTLKISSNKVGVIGAGAFGTAIANLLAHNTEVLLYTRDAEKVTNIKKTGISVGQKLAPNISITSSLQEIATQCSIIFLLIPSQGLEELLSQLSPLLRADHMLIHGIKGLYILPSIEVDANNNYAHLTREDVYTMSELILHKTKLTHVGCIGGPNLAGELSKGLLAGIVVASTSQLVMATAQKLLASNALKVYTHADIVGIELCGVLKNIIAIGTGYLAGLGQGENAKAMFISQGLVDMINIGVAMGAQKESFLTIAGIGDLIATCNSNLSRNYTLGYQLAQGKSLKAIQSESRLTAEGVKTVATVYSIAKFYTIDLPVVAMVYRILFEEISAAESIAKLMQPS